MSTFLKKVRRSLIDSGSTKKYIMYAFGEITLIVLGILIALQINNWNQWAKERDLEMKILNELYQEIDGNIERLQNAVKTLKKWNKSSEIIINTIESRDPYVDSLDIHFTFARNRGLLESVVSTESFNLYENEGFGIIQNEKLKKEILHLNTHLYGELEVIRSLWLNFLPSDFEIWKKFLYQYEYKPRKSKPFDYQKLLASQEIYSQFKNIQYARIGTMETIENCLEESIYVSNLIKEELEVE